MTEISQRKLNKDGRKVSESMFVFLSIHYTCDGYVHVILKHSILFCNCMRKSQIFAVITRSSRIPCWYDATKHLAYFA